MNSKLVILHIDGVSANTLARATREGLMPFVSHLVDAEGYEIQPYRCGVPSTTPFAQAGILYGDNSEIPSFRWWDRQRKVLVSFGARSTFERVSDRYFRGTHPLTADGASIAACFPAGAADNFGIAYQDRSYFRRPNSRSVWHVLGPYLANPVHLGDWVWQTVAVTARTVKDVADALRSGRHPARAYVIADILEEVFVHHLTRYAVQQAVHEGYSPIYAGFYAFDETAHAFGPEDPSTIRILRHVDRSIQKVASLRKDQYELLILSDHGQVDTVPYAASDGRSFDSEVAALTPGVNVRVASSGGLAHVYFTDEAARLRYSDLNRLQPNLTPALSSLPKVAFVLAREGAEDVFVKDGQRVTGPALNEMLASYDRPDILLAQLSRLNSFAASGDLIAFGAFENGSEVNFEDQAGGHGSVGGEQLHPFVLAKRDWGLDTSNVRGAHELHPLLSRLRDELLEGGFRSRSPQVGGLHQ